MNRLNQKPLLPLSARSAEMEEAIGRWQDIFHGAAPWLSQKRPKTLNLAAVSTQYLARLACAELDFSVEGTSRAKQLEAALKQELLPQLPAALQQALIGGSVALKPYVEGGRVRVEWLSAEQFYPSESGSMVFLSRRDWQGKHYLRCEEHAFEGGIYRITNRAFLCGADGRAQAELPLEKLPFWAELEAELAIENLQSPLYAIWKLPFANCVDGSDEPVSLFALAEDCLESIDKIYNDYCYEFLSARRKLILREDALRLDKNGRPVLPHTEGADDVYLPLDLAGDSAAFGDYTPNIREESYRNALNQLLRCYEAQCGLSAGSLSMDERGALTATEVLAQDRRTYYTVSSIQQQGRAALEQLAVAMDALMSLYGMGRGEYRLSIRFGDSLMEDVGSEFARRLKLVELGMKPELLLSWYFDSDEAAAKAMMKEE